MLLFLTNFNEAAASHYRVSTFLSSGWIKVYIFAALGILDNVHIIPEYRDASFIDTAAHLKGEFTQKLKFSHCLISRFVVVTLGGWRLADPTADSRNTGLGYKIFIELNDKLAAHGRGSGEQGTEDPGDAGWVVV